MDTHKRELNEEPESEKAEKVSAKQSKISREEIENSDCSSQAFYKSVESPRSLDLTSATP